MITRGITGIVIIYVSGETRWKGRFWSDSDRINPFFFLFFSLRKRSSLRVLVQYSTKPINYSRPPNQKPASITETELLLSYIHLGIDFSNSFITGIQLLLLRFLLSNSVHLDILVCLKHVCSAPLYPFSQASSLFYSNSNRSRTMCPASLA